MDVVTLGMAKADAKKKVRASERTTRQKRYLARQSPNLDFPIALTAPPAISQSLVGSINGASVISNFVVYDLRSRTDLFQVYGASLSAVRDSNYISPASMTPYDTTGVQIHAYEIYTDAPVVELISLGNATRFRILIDLMDGAGFKYANGVDGQVSISSANPVHTIVDFTAAGGRQWRRWRIESDGVYSIGRIVLDKQDTIQPLPKRGPLAIIAGDSITEGSGAGPRMDNFAAQFGRMMGWDVWASGSGGTGYTVGANGSSATRVTLGSRLQNDVIRWNPDVVIITMGRNDEGATSAALTAACNDVFSRLVAGLPDALIIVTSPLHFGTPPAAALTTRDTIKAAATAYGLTFIDMLAPVVFGGTGSVNFPNPLAGTAVATTTGGTFAAGIYEYRVAGYDSRGSTIANPVASATVAANGRITVTWPIVYSLFGWRIYRRPSGGAWELAKTIASGGTVSYVDTGTTEGAGTPPEVNTTGRALDGPADYLLGTDKVHPEPNGHRALAVWLTQQVSALLAVAGIS